MQIQTENKSYVRDTTNNALLNSDARERDRLELARAKARQSTELEAKLTKLEVLVEWLMEQHTKCVTQKATNETQ